MAAIDFPNSPTLNQEFTANGRTWIWNGTVWATKAIDTSVSRYDVSDTAPSSPTNGDVWFNSTNARTYVYYDSFWVESNPALNGTDGIVNSTTPPENTSVLWMDESSTGTGIPVPAGGVAGQILAKSSNSDYATNWVDAASGNAIINGAFEINQRNFSTSTSAGYGIDRWYNQTDTTGSGTATYSLQAFTPGTAPSAGYEAVNFLRCVTSGQSAAGVYTLFQQSIENVRTFAGQAVTISFWAKAASGAPKIAVLLSQDFGTGGSPSSSVETNTGKVTLSTSWTRHSITTTLPSLTGKTIGTNPNTSALTLLLWLSAGSNYDGRSGSLGVQNNTFDIWGVQVEAGSVPTPLKRAGGTIQGELAACQRYCVVYGGNQIYERLAMGSADTSVSMRVSVILPVKMRSTPTMSVNTLSDWQAVLPGIVGVPLTGLGLSTTESSPSIAALNGSFSSNGNYGSSKAGFICGNGNLNGRIILEAEF